MNASDSGRSSTARPPRKRRTPQQFGRRAEHTRAEILEAAEAVFAEKGFAAARLEDVAQRVGIKRASIVYYFRDKRELYETVLDNLFGELAHRFRAAISTPAPIPERMEALINAWISYAAERRAVAPIMLREAAQALPGHRAVLVPHIPGAVQATVAAVREGQDQQMFRPIDPIHFIFAIVGATVFFLSATPTLVPDWPYDPYSAEQVGALRTEVLGITRRLLGLDGRDGADEVGRANSTGKLRRRRGSGARHRARR